MADTALSSTYRAAAERDERKSAALAERHVTAEPGARLVSGFDLGREILRNPLMKQAGAGADRVVVDNPEHVSVFFLDGDLHRRRRAAIARFFTPRAIATRYRAVMEASTDSLLAQLRRTGRAVLDQSSFQLACDVAAEIVGLTDSDRLAMARRIRRSLDQAVMRRRGGLARLIGALMTRYRALDFFVRDVRPAIAARRRAPRQDVISHLVEEGYSDKAILIECMTYASAGMVTTREFIVMAAWHLFEKDALRARFLSGGEQEQIAILEEILRLEPVAAMLHRRASGPAETAGGGIAPGALLAIDIRGANVDERATGPNPHMIDPDRAERMRMAGALLSFGDGSHRCPGSQVALHETRIFLDRLLRLPGIRLVREPRLGWCAAVQGYELRGAIVTCDRT